VVKIIQKISDKEAELKRTAKVTTKVEKKKILNLLMHLQVQRQQILERNGKPHDVPTLFD